MCPTLSNQKGGLPMYKGLCITKKKRKRKASKIVQHPLIVPNHELPRNMAHQLLLKGENLIPLGSLGTDE